MEEEKMNRKQLIHLLIELKILDKKYGKYYDKDIYSQKCCHCGVQANYGIKDEKRFCCGTLKDIINENCKKLYGKYCILNTFILQFDSAEYFDLDDLIKLSKNDNPNDIETDDDSEMNEESSETDGESSDSSNEIDEDSSSETDEEIKLDNLPEAGLALEIIGVLSEAQ